MKILTGHQHGKVWCDAFEAGADDHGDLLLCWGWRWQREIKTHIANGGRVCVLECGYLGDNLEWASASMGGRFKGHGMFPKAQDRGARFDKFFDLKPWSHSDGFTLILGQMPDHISLARVNGDLAEWYEAAAQMPDAVFRPHPRAPGTAYPPGTRTIIGRREIGYSLARSLAGARVAVTFNSNAGVDAVLAGVPTIATDPGSMAWPVAAHSLSAPLVRPNRAKWAARLAWCQWTMDEMKSGAAWDALKTAEHWAARP